MIHIFLQNRAALGPRLVYLEMQNHICCFCKLDKTERVVSEL